MAITTDSSRNCSGCRACFNICPVNAITMVYDKHGYPFPQIDKDKCVDCGLCEKVCPVCSDTVEKNTPVEAYAGRIKDDDAFYNSSSGGAFWAIVKAVISKDYYVCGAKYDENLKVITDIGHTLKECEPFRKSKYVLSDLGNCFVRIERLLKNNEKVLFTATPCQVSALKNYLKLKNIKSDNLITVDLLCNGVASQVLFDEYLNSYNVCGKPVSSFTFRSKEPINGKTDIRSARVSFKDGSFKLVTSENDAYLRGYYWHLFTHSLCGKCSYVGRDRVGDITIGDAWGVGKFCPEVKASKGASLILFNTDKGKSLFEDINSEMTLHKLDINDALESQAILKGETITPYRRPVFFRKHKKYGFEKAVWETGPKSRIKRILVAVDAFLQKFVATDICVHVYLQRSFTFIFTGALV